MNTPTKSVYERALDSKELAANILLPLIEFEFAFHGAQKPAITQAASNLNQLKTLFKICKKHQWLSTKRITKLGNKNEYWFKITNTGFKEIYGIAGPMADKTKDKWAILLCERAKGIGKNRKAKKEILSLLKKANRPLTTLEICLRTRRLPYTATRHLRKMEKEELVRKNVDGWIVKR